MSRTKWAGLAAAMIIALGVAWYFASPWYTLKQMKSAAAANDADALSSYIDYPSLREDLKSDLMAQMMADASKDKSGFGPLGVAIGSALIGPAIDGMVSPAGVRAMMLSRHDKDRPGSVNVPAAPVKVESDPVIERRSFSEFVVRSKSDPDGGMVFTRHGLGWKLSGVDLPQKKASRE
jgi:hypothetical protein